MKWVDRVFDSNVPSDLYPELIERLRGTPARMEELTESMPATLLVRREEEKWSIQEHAGHLIDVEDLFLGRLDDYEAGKPALRPAELSGRKTFEANHNESDIASILTRFRRVRGKYVQRLEGWDATVFRRSALHPRLNRQMTVTDMLHFQAEHDDHHLARITELVRRFGKSHLKNNVT